MLSASFIIAFKSIPHFCCWCFIWLTTNWLHRIRHTGSVSLPIINKWQISLTNESNCLCLSMDSPLVLSPPALGRPPFLSLPPRRHTHTHTHCHLQLGSRETTQEEQHEVTGRMKTWPTKHFLTSRQDFSQCVFVCQKTYLFCIRTGHKHRDVL